MAGLVSSVCTNEWMEVIMAAPVWNRSVHFDSVTSPAQPIPSPYCYTRGTTKHCTALHEEMLNIFLYVSSRPSLQ